MTFKMKHVITYDYINNSINRKGTKAPNRVFGTAHDTGNKNSTARNNVNYFNRKYQTIKGIHYELGRDKNNNLIPFRTASAHSFTDDKEIIICVPLDEPAWHVLYNLLLDNHLFGDDANDIGIGHELCFFDDVSRSKKAYEKFVWLWAYTFHLYNWKISEVKRLLVSHYFLDPKRKTDPMNAFKLLGITYDDFLDDVVKEYEDCTVSINKPVTVEEVKIEGECKLEPLLSWQKELGEKALDELQKEGLITNAIDWKLKLGEHVPNWLLFTLLTRIANKK